MISHPQADLAARCATCNPVLATVEHSHRRNSSDPIATKLGQLIAGAAVNIDEAVHVTDTESLDVGLGVHLPLRTKTGKEQVSKMSKERFGSKAFGNLHSHPTAGLAVMPHNSVRAEFLVRKCMAWLP